MELRVPTEGHFAEGQGEHNVCLEVAEIIAENPFNEVQENQQRWTEEEKQKEQVEGKNEEREAVQETKKNKWRKCRRYGGPARKGGWLGWHM